nr:hypothetical protein [Tanacetum cinerariifolium]
MVLVRCYSYENHNSSYVSNRSPVTSVPVLPLVSGALSPIRADLIPSPKRVKHSGYLVDVEVGPRETKVERVTQPAMPEDIPEPAQEGAVEFTYETLGDLVQKFHDHAHAILVYRIQVIEGVQREQGHMIVGVELAVTALTERVAKLERDNRRLRGTDNALTWWNSHKRTIGVDAAYAMKWVRLMKLMTEELILLCTRMVPNKEDSVERFIGELPDNIQGNVIVANPARLQDAIRIAN